MIAFRRWSSSVLGQLVPALLLGGALAVGASGCGGGDSAPVTLVINEIMPSNMSSACVDEGGGNADWIELYNTGNADVSLEGLSITDDPDSPLKKRFGKGLVVPKGGVIMLWADDSVDQGPAHLPFKLSAESEQVILYDAGGKMIDSYAWTSASPDLSFARLPNGTGAFSVCALPSCGKVNGTSCGS